MSRPPTGEVWTRREYAFLAGWMITTVVLFLIPPGVRACLSQPLSDYTALNSAWAAAAGILGGLLNPVRLQVDQQTLKERVKRGLVFEPGLGAVVAWFVYFAVSLDIVTINLGTLSAGLPDFGPTVVLSVAAGFVWDIVLGRVRTRVEDSKQP